MAKRGPKPHPELLTPREQDVLALLREGLTNAQIAERLGITPETAKYHVSEILSKLHVTTREQAAAWREPERHRAWRLLGAAASLLVLTSAVAGLGLLGWGLSRAGTSASSSATPLNAIVGGPVYYLPPTDGSPEIASPDLLDAANITVVGSSADLFALAPADYTAVIIDKTRLADVNSNWLSKQRLAGKVIVGARVKMDDLLQAIGAPSSDAPWTPYGPDRNFFSLYSECSTQGGLSQGGAQDQLDERPDSDFRFMLALIASHARNCLPPTPAPAPTFAPLASIEDLLAAPAPDPATKRDSPAYDTSSIRIVRDDGTDETELAIGFSPVWSHRGDRLAFSSLGDAPFNSGAGQIGIVDIASPDAIAVGHFAEDDTASCPITTDGHSITWSADDSTVAFYSDNPDQNIRIARSDGAGSVDFTNGCTPAWSPDGWALAYGNGHGVRVVDARSGASISSTPGLAIDEISWSPDASLIAYLTAVPNYPTIVVIDAQTGKTTCEMALESSQFASGRAPAWAPDSRSFAVSLYAAQGNSGTDAIWIVDSLACTRRELVDGSSPSWSPDGTQIAYATGDSHIALTPPAGGDAVVVTQGDQPTWSPDGQWLAFTRVAAPPTP